MYAQGHAVIGTRRGNREARNLSLFWVVGLDPLGLNITVAEAIPATRSNTSREAIPKGAVTLSNQASEKAKSLLANIDKEVGSIDSFSNSENLHLKDKLLFIDNHIGSIPKNFNKRRSYEGTQTDDRDITDGTETTAFNDVRSQLLRNSRRKYGAEPVVYAELTANTLTFEEQDSNLYWNMTRDITYPDESLRRLRQIRPQPSDQPLLGEAIKNAFVGDGKLRQTKLRLKDFNDAIGSVLHSQTAMEAVLESFQMNLVGMSHELRIDKIAIPNLIKDLRQSLEHYYRDFLFDKAKCALDAYRPPFIRTHKARSKLILPLELEKKLKVLSARYRDVFKNIYEPEIIKIVNSSLSDSAIVDSIIRSRPNDPLNVFTGRNESIRLLLKQMGLDESDPEIRVFAAFVYQQLASDIANKFAEARFSNIPDLFDEEVLKTFVSRSRTNKSLLDMINHLGKLPFRTAIEFGCQLMSRILHREILLDANDLVKQSDLQAQSRVFSVCADRQRAPEYIPFLGIKTKADKCGGLSFYGLPIPEDVRADILTHLNNVCPGQHDAKEYHFSRNSWQIAQIYYKINPSGLITTDQPSPLKTSSSEDKNRAPLHLEYLQKLDFESNKSLLSNKLTDAKLADSRLRGSSRWP